MTSDYVTNNTNSVIVLYINYSPAEISVVLLFVMLVLLWLFLRPGFMPGWADALFKDGYVGNSVPTILILCITFVIPLQPACCSSTGMSMFWSHHLLLRVHRVLNPDYSLDPKFESALSLVSYSWNKMVCCRQ